MSKLKAITTHYNGYRFRSRTEARWAVFFDTLKLAYEYEPEGYEIDGICYLPDFYLPTLGVHAEVKAAANMITPKELKKIYAFALGGDKPTLLLLGTPGNHKMLLVDRRHSVPLEDYYDEIDEAAVAETISELELEGSVTIAPIPCGEFRRSYLVYTSLPPYEDCAWSESIKAAREARFEFGR